MDKKIKKSKVTVEKADYQIALKTSLNMRIRD